MMRPKNLLLASLLALPLALPQVACNKTDSAVNEDVKTQPIYDEVLKSLELVNKLEKDFRLGLFLQQSAPPDQTKIMRQLEEVKVALYRLKRDQTDEAAQANFIRVRQLLTNAPIAETDRAQFNALMAQLDVLTGYFDVSVDGELYSNSFEGSLGEFSQYRVVGSVSFEPDENNYLKISAFPSKKAAETWLISPLFDFSAVPTASLEIRQAVGFLKDWSDLQVLVSNDYTGGNPNDASWDELTIDKKPAVSSKWDFVTSEPIDLSERLGPATSFAFKYTASDESQSTWEIDSFTLSGEASGPFAVTPLKLSDGQGETGPASGELKPEAATAVLPVAGTSIFHDWFNRADDLMLKTYEVINLSGDNEWRGGSRPNGAAVQTYVGMSGFKDPADNNDWLITPEIDLSSATSPYLQLVETVNYLLDWDNLAVVVSSDFSGDVASATWSENLVPRPSAKPESWTDYTSEGIALDAYKGQKIRIGFHYRSKASAASTATWRLQEILVADGEAVAKPTEESLEASLSLPEESTFYHDWFNRSQDTMSEGYELVNLLGKKSWRGGSFVDSETNEIATYLAMSGFKEENEGDNLDWLVTPKIELTAGSQPFLQLIETFAYLKDWQNLQVFVAAGYNGDFAAANWTQLDMQRPTDLPGKFERVVSKRVDLSAYAGQTIAIGMKYQSKAASASTWQINEILVGDQTNTED